VSLIRSTEQYHDLLRALVALNGDEPLAIDTETTGLRPWVDSELRGVSLAWRDQAVYVPVSHPHSWNVDNPGLLGEVLNERCWAGPIVYHNRNFDTAVLERGIGMRPKEGAGRFWDTAVVSWLLEENTAHGLKKIAAKLWGEDEAAEQQAVKAMMKGETQAEAYKRLRLAMAAEGRKEPATVTREQAKVESAASKRGWGDLTAEELAPYAAQDAALTLRLYLHQLADPALPPRNTIYREFELQEVVYKLMRLGIKIDRRRVAETRAQYLCRIAEIEAQMAPTNLGSPKQLAELIFGEWGLEPLELTKGGAPSTSKDALDLHAGAHPGLDLILEYRRLQKAVATYFDALLENADSDDRVHTSLNQIGTTTGRFSSSAPNLQNIPRDGTNSDVRDVFIAEPGFVLLSADMSQAELRIAASLANEHSMLDRFQAGEDIYQGTADALGIPRQQAKIVVLASGYGIGARKLARGLAKGTGRQPNECDYWIHTPDDRRAMRLKRCYSCEVCQTKEHLDNYWSSVPFLKDMNRRLIDFAEANQYVPLHVSGRRRHYPNAARCRELGVIKWPKPYTALNSVIQGGCAEIVKDWLILADRELPRMGARLVLTVHDSAVVETPIGTEDRVREVLQLALDHVTPKGWMRIPIEMKVGV
jgi:DNA polymerase-1